MILQSLSPVFGAVVKLRNWAFDQGFIESQECSVPVISVGNLTVGGTGKTPFSLYLLQEFQKRGVKAGLISRGYKGQYQGVTEVDLERDWNVFGDEPSMIKRRFPQTPVFLSAKRSEAARLLTEKYSVDLILADDAFQHRYLERDMDIVLLDATQSPEEYHLLPWGRMREPWSALERADWVVMTKTNLLPVPEREERIKFLESHLRGFQARRLQADLVPRLLEDTRGQAVFAESLGAYFLISGIGRPQSFEETAERFFKRPAEKHFIFSDHHFYQTEDINRILRALPEKASLVTTEKDFIRLRSFSELRQRLTVLRVGFEITGATNEFWNEVSRLTR